jgi:hypothetical protein
MGKKIILVLTALVLICSCIKSQSLKLGFRVEPTILFTESNNSRYTHFSMYSFYLTTLLEPVGNFGFELRPGLIYGSPDYKGYDVGAYVKYNFVSNFYLLAGLNNHYNAGGGYVKNYIYKCIGLGYQRNSKLSFDIGYYWTGDKVLADLRMVNYLGPSTYTDEKMNGILKLGFSLAWEIF